MIFYICMCAFSLAGLDPMGGGGGGGTVNQQPFSLFSSQRQASSSRGGGRAEKIPTADSLGLDFFLQYYPDILWWSVRVKVNDLKSLLGDSSSGGGPEDLRVIANIKAFVSRHTDTFAYDAVTKRLSLSGDKGIDPAAEARVVHRLKAKLSSAPHQAASYTTIIKKNELKQIRWTKQFSFFSHLRLLLTHFFGTLSTLLFSFPIFGFILNFFWA